MKKMKNLAILTAVAMLLGTVPVFAEIPAVEKTDRFIDVGDWSATTLKSADGELVIHIHDEYLDI